MARITHEREDLLRDARALVPRLQLHFQRSCGTEQTVFAGFRGEALSIYIGDDPVFHFDAQGRLRRAFVDDRLIKAARGRLVAMQRVRTEREVVLQSTALDEAAESRLLETLATTLSELRAALAAGAFVVDGEVPPAANALARLAEWLERHPRPTPSPSPHVR
jgi:hypothetical protein